MTNIKEDLQLIAALTANTAGFIKNNINSMVVGDGNNLKSDIKVQEVIQKATKELVSEYSGGKPPTPVSQAVKAPQPVPVQQMRPPVVVDTARTFTPVEEIITQNYKPQGNQLEFNFDNSPTAQNIYHKLNTIIQSIERLDKRVNELSEHIIKKKLDKKEKRA